jgi:hypothetical protein
MNIQLWIASNVPELLPEFVNPCITEDYYHGKRIYIFSIDVYSEIFGRCRTPDNKCKIWLKYYGFIKPQKIYQGFHSEIFINDNMFPPKLSELLTVW